MMKFWISVVTGLALAACGDNGGGSGGGSSSAGATEGGGATTGSSGTPTTSGDPVGTSTSGASAGGTTGGDNTTGNDPDTSATGGGESSGGASTGAGTTGALGSTSTGSGSTGELSASDDGGTSSESSGESTTGADMCFIGDVEDTLDFTYVKSIDLVDIDTIQASYYNFDANEIVFFSFYGKGRRFSIDGQALGDVMAPPEALPKLDGASYDQVNKVAMLITQDCRLVEADPVTLQTIKSIQLDKVKFKIGVCAGVAVGVDGDMYVISWQTEEMVRMSRDGQTEYARVNLLALDLSRPDGISLIAGSENFLILSSAKKQAAILTPKGLVVVPPGTVGQNFPPFKGGNIVNPDASLTVCGNGHAWLCDEYGTKCHDYAPAGGDKDACACTIPQ